MAKKTKTSVAHGGLGDLADIVSTTESGNTKKNADKKTATAELAESVQEKCYKFLSGVLGTYILFGLELRVENRRSSRHQEDFLIARLIDCEHDHPISGLIRAGEDGAWWPLEQLRWEPEAAGWKDFPDHRVWKVLSKLLHCEEDFATAARRYWEELREREAIAERRSEEARNAQIAAAEEAALKKQLLRHANPSLDYILTQNGLWVDTDVAGKKLIIGTFRGDVRIELVEEGHDSGLGKQHHGVYMHIKDVVAEPIPPQLADFILKFPKAGEVRSGLRHVLVRQMILKEEVTEPADADPNPPPAHIATSASERPTLH